jgi:cytochrome c oxidase assembly factor CtaG
VTYTPPDPSTYYIPSAQRRAAIAVLYLIPAILLYVVIPYVGLSELSKFGISTGYSFTFIVIAGISLAVLGAVGSFMRPTRAYGPLRIASSVGAILYLLILASSSQITIGIGNSGSFTLAYAGMITLFAVVPTIRIGAGVTTTIEDALRPGERLPFDFPAKS